MATKRITDVDIIDSLNGNESFFINQNSTIKQINKSNIVFGINNGGTGATSVAGARDALGLGNTDGALPIENGGTGATTTAEALVKLGAQLKHITTTVTLPVSSWETGSQTVDISNVTTSSTIIVSPIQSSHIDYCRAGVYCSSQEDGKLTFTAEYVPTANLTVNILILN